MTSDLRACYIPNIGDNYLDISSAYATLFSDDPELIIPFSTENKYREAILFGRIKDAKKFQKILSDKGIPCICRPAKRIDRMAERGMSDFGRLVHNAFVINH